MVRVSDMIHPIFLYDVLFYQICSYRDRSRYHLPIYLNFKLKFDPEYVSCVA
jgi:hypothetical protein